MLMPLSSLHICVRVCVCVMSCKQHTANTEPKRKFVGNGNQINFLIHYLSESFLRNHYDSLNLSNLFDCRSESLHKICQEMIQQNCFSKLKRKL